MSKRSVNGILLLNKARGESSNAALQKVKRLYAAKKAGHLGTLDPLATGMLPICFGEATKFAQYSIIADKSYEVVAKLGIKTNTGDREGNIVQERPVKLLSLDQLEQVLNSFRGEIMQVPSMFSALKHQGQPLYQLARQGIEIERSARAVHIYHLELIDYQKETLILNVHCSKGTYIRTLVDDIGEQLGCGAHVEQLHRTQVGNYSSDQMISFEELTSLFEQDEFVSLDKQLIPIDTLVQALPEIKLTQDAAYYLQRGQSVVIPQLNLEGEVRLTQPDGSFLGVGKVEGMRVHPKRLIVLN